jgi:hypothetical protein
MHTPRDEPIESDHLHEKQVQIVEEEKVLQP